MYTKHIRQNNIDDKPMSVKTFINKDAIEKMAEISHKNTVISLKENAEDVTKEKSKKCPLCELFGENGDLTILLLALLLSDGGITNRP